MRASGGDAGGVARGEGGGVGTYHGSGAGRSLEKFFKKLFFLNRISCTVVGNGEVAEVHRRPRLRFAFRKGCLYGVYGLVGWRLKRANS